MPDPKLPDYKQHKSKRNIQTEEQEAYRVKKYSDRKRLEVEWGLDKREVWGLDERAEAPTKWVDEAAAGPGDEVHWEGA